MQLMPNVFMLTRKKLDMTTQKTTRPLSQRQMASVIFKDC